MRAINEDAVDDIQNLVLAVLEKGHSRGADGLDVALGAIMAIRVFVTEQVSGGRTDTDGAVAATVELGKFAEHLAGIDPECRNFASVVAVALPVSTWDLVCDAAEVGIEDSDVATAAVKHVRELITPMTGG